MPNISSMAGAWQAGVWPLTQAHVVGHELDMAEAEPAQRVGDVLCDRLVALPGAGIAGLLDDGAGDRLVATEDHGEPHPVEQALDLILQTFQIGGQCRCSGALRWPHYQRIGLHFERGHGTPRRLRAYSGGAKL